MQYTMFERLSPGRLVAPIFMATLVAACGGGGGGGTGPGGGIAPGEISVYAGSLQEKGSADGVGAAAQFNRPVDVALDAAGNTYVADTLNHAIRKVAPDGTVTTLAGAAGQAGSADGPAAQARFNGPSGVAVNAQGDVFVADTGNHVIRKISAAGVVSTVAGAVGQPGTADGPGAAARFMQPSDLAFDVQGNLYVVDHARVVRRIRPDGTVGTFAGAYGESASVAGDGTAARFAGLLSVAVDAAGTVYTAEATSILGTPGIVRRFDADARALPWGSTAQGLVSAWGVTDLAAAGPGQVFASAGGSFPGGGPRSLVIVNHVYRITAAGETEVLAGAGRPGHADSATAAVARFNVPEGIAVAGNGRIVVADTGNEAIRQIDPQGRVSTLAGGLGIGHADGPAAQARFYDPSTIQATAAGSLYIYDVRNYLVRRISAAGEVSTVDVGQTLVLPNFGFALAAAPDETLYLWKREYIGGTPLSVKPPQGQPQLFVENVGEVTGMTAAPGGVYLTDGFNLRRVTSDGRVSQVASGQGGEMVVAANGTIYFADGLNHTVSSFDPATGVSKLVAGSPGQPGAVDGPAAGSRLNNPRALAADTAGNVYVADATTIRRISPDGQVRSVAGSASQVAGPVVSPLVRAMGRIKDLTWHGGFLYATVDNAVLRISPLP
jgi:streptogramin lyase